MMSGPVRTAAALAAFVILAGAGSAAAQMVVPPSTVVGPGGATRVPGIGSAPSAATADYPTAAIADYVFACMSSNGNTRTALEQCSCSFDVMASLLPYDRYTEASTFLSMQQVSGEKGALFRGGVQQQAAIDALRRAQAEAEVRCFD
ncbi:MAG TPA: hypothetical protein VGO17_18085 [Aurantimonas sp.]|nr:hypothetical protein [Aurantimonas sp.]